MKYLSFDFVQPFKTIKSIHNLAHGLDKNKQQAKSGLPALSFADS